MQSTIQSSPSAAVPQPSTRVRRVRIIWRAGTIFPAAIDRTMLSMRTKSAPLSSGLRNAATGTPLATAVMLGAGGGGGVGGGVVGGGVVGGGVLGGVVLA